MCKSARPIRLFLCGDVMTGRGIDQILPSPSEPRIHEGYVSSAIDYVVLAERANGPIARPVDFSYIWGAALEELERMKPDVRIINLETSITRSEDFFPKGINYRMSPENIGCLLAAGIDCCVLANNHMLDWGEAGLVDTLRLLETHRVKTVGAGRNSTEASAPAILDIPGGGRVVVFAFASVSSGTPRSWAAKRDRPGVNLLADFSDATADAIASEINGVRRPGDVVVVSIHWGPNWGYQIPEEHRRFAHALIERANVAIVHGHSSHHAKGIEVHKGRLILYGCGDFLNDYEGISGYEAFRDDLAVMYFADIDPERGELTELELVPLQIRRFRLNRTSDRDTEWLRATIEREGRKFGLRFERTASDKLALLRHSIAGTMPL